MKRNWGFRIWILVAAGVLAAIALGIALVSTGSDDSTASANPLTACLEQLASTDPDMAAAAAEPDAEATEPEAEATEPDAEATAAEAEAGETEEVEPEAEGGETEAGGSPARARCAARPRASPSLQMPTMPSHSASRPDSTADYEAAARQRTQLASADAPRVRGAGGRWEPVGRGPLHADDPDYPGRPTATASASSPGASPTTPTTASTTASTPRSPAAASGGPATGQDWTSIGETLPTQTVGSVAYSPAGGGTLIAVTGDNAFGGNTYGGLGVFRSTNERPHLAARPGVPTRRTASRPRSTPPIREAIYAATGAGLFRSTDAGRTSAT